MGKPVKKAVKLSFEKKCEVPFNPTEAVGVPRQGVYKVGDKLYATDSGRAGNTFRIMGELKVDKKVGQIIKDIPEAEKSRILGVLRRRAKKT